MEVGITDSSSLQDGRNDGVCTDKTELHPKDYQMWRLLATTTTVPHVRHVSMCATDIRWHNYFLIHMHQYMGIVAAVVALAAQTSVAQACTARGENVTVSGFVMDNLCISLGTLLDNPTVLTLKGPDVHSIHCLVDVRSCVASKYAILAPPANGSDLYSVKYQLGQDGSTTAKAYAEAARALGGKQGFSVTVTGIDDGTNELQCVTVSRNVVVDGKALSLPATSINSAAGLAAVVPVAFAVAAAWLA
ncbi:hypothetical protein H310_13043 [Aphanomyces invadans]|uniref:SRS domain-containing protein n=1 Tax=Aphanomyces invadans TaxID=157072 RepID=A0A024THP3_9STRA|nr:hypothetical protein H310_13043 [Aphanomyces invadans]ETV92852.1 hypothetical protein H310_13043 [Aphanomyces invadans]|eukprot:XP_008878622.1 hypothetical protein H310_13043 [Aphanomyces invadans]